MRLFLIDGSALAYRSHFAFIRNPLINSRGMHTSAVFGFMSTLHKLLELEKPDLIAVIFDSKEDTFRHEIYADYKATREKMPDEMVDQLPYIQKAVEALRIPFIAMPRYEADDIIGTLVRQAETHGIDSYIVSGDKDFMQLLTPKTFIYNMKKVGEIEILDLEAPKKKWGVPAEHVIDLLGLMGDASDHVPGVPGVGEKTASKLVGQFGSMEEIYRRIDEVTPPKLRDNLAKHKEQAEMCKHLVTIDTHVPLKISVEELKANTADLPRIKAIYEELEFTSLLDSVAKQSLTTKPSTTQYHLVKDREALCQLAKRLSNAKTFSVDTETTSLHVVDAEAIGLSFSMKAGEAFYVPLRHAELPASLVWEALRPVLEDASRPKGGQNSKYDLNVLRNAGVTLRGLAFDSMIESYLLDPSTRQHGLDALAIKFLGLRKIPTTDLIGTGSKQISMADVDVDRVSTYACEDADVALQLHELFLPQIEHQELSKLYHDVELPLLEVLADMEYAGIALDIPFLKKLSAQLAKRLEELIAELQSAAGEPVNLNSPKQLGPLLFEKLRIQDSIGARRVRKTKTGYSTDQDTLEAYGQHPFVKNLLEYRNLTKLKSTYVDALISLVHPKTGRVHTSFNQTIAATGRLSSSDPNLQNIPIRTELGRELRKAFIPGKKGWKLLSADYSQIELRILAHLSEDKVLIDTFQKNEDVHRRTAAMVFGLKDSDVTSEIRGRAKAINFGVIYGMGSQRLASETGISLDEAKSFIEAYFTRLSGVKHYLEEQVRSAREKGYVTTLLGRKRAIPELNSGNPGLVANAERIATNTPIQGTAADLIKVAMIQIDRELKKRKMQCRLLLQVHDELVFELPESEVEVAKKLVKEGMEGAMNLRVPLLAEVGVGDTWAEAH